MRKAIAATKQDWVALLTDLDRITLRFCQTGAHMSPDIEAYDIESVPGLGHSQTGMIVQDASYLVQDERQELKTRHVIRNDGSAIWLVDQRLNENSLILRPGGVFASDYFIVGELSSIYPINADSLWIKLLLNRTRRKGFMRGSYFGIAGECYAKYSKDQIFTSDFRTYQERLPGINTGF